MPGKFKSYALENVAVKLGSYEQTINNVQELTSSSGELLDITD